MTSLGYKARFHFPTVRYLYHLYCITIYGKLAKLENEGNIDTFFQQGRASSRATNSMAPDLISTPNTLTLRRWDHVGFSYDYNTGMQKLWHNGQVIKQLNVGVMELATQRGFRTGNMGDHRQSLYITNYI